jgi:hypothetical protein
MKTTAKLALFFFVLVLFPSLARAQCSSYTQATGTVTDPSSVPWAGATLAIALQNSSGTSPTCTGADGLQHPFTTQFSVTLDPTGSFAIQLPPNSGITPSGTQWSFTATITVPPPVGRGNQTFSYTGTISGSSQSLSSALSALAPALLYGSSSGAPGANSPMPEFALYTVYINSGTVYARNNSTAAIDYSSTDAAVVVNDILTNNQATCGTVYFQNGDYPLNSMTLESTGGYSNYYYAIGIPPNSSTTSNYCQWKFVGEQAGSVDEGVAAAQGVIFDVTAAALTSCGTGHECIAWWARPDTTNHVGNDVFFENIMTRFPGNTRGNEAAFLMWEASTIEYQNVIATLDEAVGSGPGGCPNIVPATAGTNRMIGMSSTYSGHNNWEHFRDTYVIGYDIAYEVDSEHTVMDSASAQCNNYFAYYGRVDPLSTILHPSVWTKVTDEENTNGIVLGSFTAQGSLLNISGYDIEMLTSGQFARSTNMSETNCGYSSGVISYSVISAAGGNIAEIPPDQLFSSCGQNFELFEGTTSPNIARTPSSDTFTRANSTTLGPGWYTNGTVGSCATTYGGAGISGNTAYATVSGGAGCYYTSLTAQPDQFSKATLATVDSNGAGVTVRYSTAGAVTGYYFKCSTGGMILSKNVAGTGTSLATNSVACAATGTIELKAIGTSLFAYYNGTLELTAVDSSIASGQPGIWLGSATAADDSLTNWTGGSIPLFDINRSIYSLPAIHPTYQTVTNCAAAGTGASPSVASCGSAAAGHFSCATNATGATCQVNTTAVDANSEIFVFDADTTAVGTILGVTCNTSTAIDPTSRLLASQTAGTGFVINLGTVTTNPACFSYHIVN